MNPCPKCQSKKVTTGSMFESGGRWGQSLFRPEGLRRWALLPSGGILASEKIDIGVVEGIVGINWWDVEVSGFANHAGTTPMNQRHDALLAAAKFIEAVNRIVTSEPGRQVGTVGRIQALPGAPNVIPGKVVLSLELRDLDAGKINLLYQKINTAAQQIAGDSGTRFDFKEINVNIPAPTNPKIRELIAESARDLGLTTRTMPSGAGHDAQDMARLTDVGMIFVPSIGGISHSPKEFSGRQTSPMAPMCCCAPYLSLMWHERPAREPCAKCGTGVSPVSHAPYATVACLTRTMRKMRMPLPLSAD